MAIFSFAGGYSVRLSNVAYCTPRLYAAAPNCASLAVKFLCLCTRAGMLGLLAAHKDAVTVCSCATSGSRIGCGRELYGRVR